MASPPAHRREPHAVATNGTAYDLHGPAGAPVLVLIHGLGLCRHLWDPHIPALSARYLVLNYDLYGHGDSSPAPGEASLSVYADQIVAMMDEVGVDAAALVGFSIGGMINRRVALDHRDRLWALAILSSPHDRGDEAQRLVEERARQVRAGGPMATMDAALDRWFTPDFLARRKDVAEQVRAWRRRVDPESYAQAAWVLAHGVRELIDPSPPLSLATLVMTGEHDSGSTPAMAHAIAAEIPGAEAVIVPGLQHLGLLEAPDAFTAPVLDHCDRNQP